MTQNFNKNAGYINNRLSLRKPQSDSLKILQILADDLRLEKIEGDADLLKMELEKVKLRYPICTDFERDFPSLCFALATGVGKTRLAGAFIAYLYSEKGIKNFFILAPNLTVYNKLIEDFSNPNHSKYVFKGLSQFANNPPNVITGDNYKQFSQMSLFASDININVFNISKINAETRKGAKPQFRSMSEILGSSYFEYLKALPDLVMIMDESHHYRAARGMKVLNELNPILGLELTATPQIEKGTKTIKFKNVVFEYSLALAIQDGFVKQPAIATRKDFDPKKFTADELDFIKLEDGIKTHESTKADLNTFARNNSLAKVKPFVLVVAKDTTHATKLKELIQSEDFFNGRYADKVIEVHSNQSGSEKDENIAELVSLESPENTVEIVVHVNMLKEGWDVTNLYTIIPLRTAASMTLREQTIGRGLRLPYGKRMGDKAVDTLTVIAHDKFQEIVDAANQPDSIIRREYIIEIDEEELNRRKEAITAPTLSDQKIAKDRAEIEKIVEPEKKAKATRKLEDRISLRNRIYGMSSEVTNINKLNKKEIKELVIKKEIEKIRYNTQIDLFEKDRMEELNTVYDEIIEEIKQEIIEIPRITTVLSGEVVYKFGDFDLDVSGLNFQPGTDKLMIYTLSTGEIEVKDLSGQKIKYDTVENIVINEIVNFPEVDYEKEKDLLVKLVSQTLGHFKSYLAGEDELRNVVYNHKKTIGDNIYAQMMEHFERQESEFAEPELNVRPYSKILPHNFTKYEEDSIHDLRDTIQPTRDIPKKVFAGFKKACHSLYKFDSKTEKDFAIICENDSDALKWLRPALNQFRIYYQRNSHTYQPDFVIETAEVIYMVETKKKKDMTNDEVKEKAKAAQNYCKNATTYNTMNGGKPWKYVLIPHDAVQVNMGLKGLMERFEY